jgi:nucleoside-diphosphate-sugar epimerase
MKILITGGAGYIGSTLTPVLLGQGHQVRVFDQLDGGGHGLLACCANPGFSFIQGDIGDEPALASALEGADVIIHLAAVVGYPACQREPERAVSTNVNGTKLLLDLRQPNQRLLFASTGSVYGAVTKQLCTEASPCAPVTLYGSTKLDGEELVLSTGNCVVFRFATAFGPSPRIRFDLLPNDFVNQAVRQRKLVVYERGFRRTFIHVADIARSVVFALDRWRDLQDDIFNVGHESMNITKEELATRIQHHVDFKLFFEEFAADEDQRNYMVSYEKIRRKGFIPERGLNQGIAELVTAARLMARPTSMVLG